MERPQAPHGLSSCRYRSGDVLLSMARCPTAGYIASRNVRVKVLDSVQSGGLEGIRRDLSDEVGWMEHPDAYHAAVQRAASSAVALSAVVRWATRKQYIVPGDLTAEQTLEWQKRLVQGSWESAWIVQLAQNLDAALQRAFELDPHLPARTVDAELEAELMDARRRAAESSEGSWGALSDPAAAGVLAPSLRRWVRDVAPSAPLGAAPSPTPLPGSGRRACTAPWPPQRRGAWWRLRWLPRAAPSDHDRGS